VADTTILETSACQHQQEAEETLVEEVEVTKVTNPTEAVEVPVEDSVEDSVEATVEDSVEATVEEEETVVEEVKLTRIRKSPLKKKVTVNNYKNTQINLHYFLKIIT
jgi:hypothetical protein